MDRPRTFILGIGAQKCGTSWYRTYLSESGSVATNPMREYHIWDALHIPHANPWQVKESERMSTWENRIRFFLQQSQGNYFSYFSHMMDTQHKAISFDITPLYSGLDREVFRMIKQGFNQGNVTTKAVFLMRDPVERCWSAARMESRFDNGHTAVDEDMLMQHVLFPLTELRARYDITVGEIEAAFEEHEIYIGIYEEMFDPQALERLSVFSGVPTNHAKSTNRVNATEVSGMIDERTAARIAMHYRDVYDFAAKRFPQTSRLWRGFRYI